MSFEIVHTVPDWYDGPRGGIANYNGAPHIFQSEFRDFEIQDGEFPQRDTFLLMPIDARTFALAMEDWAIWRRYETALYKQEVTSDHHPSLPQERNRHMELEAALDGKLQVDPARSIRKKAEFRPREDPNWSGYGWRPLEVRWLEIEDFEVNSLRTSSGSLKYDEQQGMRDLSSEELLRQYADGVRDFIGVHVADGSNLCRGNLSGVTFQDGIFSDIDAREANLRNSIFRNMNLKCTDFRGADLSSAVFENVSIEHAAFRGAIVDGTQFREMKFHNHNVEGFAPDDWT